MTNCFQLQCFPDRFGKGRSYSRKACNIAGCGRWGIIINIPGFKTIYSTIHHVMYVLLRKLIWHIWETRKACQTLQLEVSENKNWEVVKAGWWSRSRLTGKELLGAFPWYCDASIRAPLCVVYLWYSWALPLVSTSTSFSHCVVHSGSVQLRWRSADGMKCSWSCTRKRISKVCITTNISDDVHAIELVIIRQLVSFNKLDSHLV